ncbi:MAG: DUF222 domain-containing protein [Marmoricola sp.]
MSAAPLDYGEHRVSVALARMSAELDELVDVGVWSMSGAEVATTLPGWTKFRARVAEVELRVAHHADRLGMGSEVGAADTSAWWANTTRMTRAEARRSVRLAQALDSAHAPVRDAMAAGHLLVDQAQVIIDAVDALPSDLVDPEVAAAAEAHLIGLGADHDAKALRILGRRILDVIAPEIGEAHERRILEREEANARKGARFSMGDDGHGQCHGKFTIPSLHGAMLKKALLAISAPKHQAATGDTAPLGDRVSAPLRMGQAFMEYIETYPAKNLPNAGGLDARVVVTIDYDVLTGALKSGSLDNGARISAAEAIRIACEAAIIPQVLGTAGVVLHQGRKTRFHTPAQRVALATRDGGCTVTGCDWPPGMCQAHHNTPWSKGGHTSLENGRLLCPRHHSYAHNPTYEMTDSGQGKVRFHRRT